MEEIVIEMGFESLEEFNKLVSSVDLTDKNKLDKFNDWKNNDGTKEGLLPILS